MKKTKFAVLDEKNPDRTIIEEAGITIKNGGLVAFPTETVYGLGGDALQSASSRKIYAAKGRPCDNPLIVHICRWEDIEKIAVRIPAAAVKLADAFWPGPLTMILEKSALVPAETTGGLSTVAVRMPSHPAALALIAAAGGYVAAPSANTSGRPSPIRAEHVREDLDGRIDMIVDGGGTEIGLESTIVDLTEPVPVILRPGFVTKEMMEEVLQTAVEVDRSLPAAGQAPRAPGMKYRHYAPRGKMTVVSGDREAVIRTIGRLAAEKRTAGERVGVICTDETKPFYEADCIASAGGGMDAEAAARHLYEILRSFDSRQVTYIYSEAFPGEGIGQAVMNRLLKAAGHHILEVS